MAMDLLETIARAINDFMNGTGPLLALVYIAVAGLPMTLLHELGHAVAAVRLLGEDVKVEVGSVGRFAELQLGRIAVSMNAVAGPGRAGVAEFDDSRATARDVLLIAVAGPAASLVGVLVAAFVLYAASPAGVVAGLLWTATLVGIVGVLNIVPFRYQTSRRAPAWRSDGRLALDAARVLHALR
jgi:hypothetical protein